MRPSASSRWMWKLPCRRPCAPSWRKWDTPSKPATTPIWISAPGNSSTNWMEITLPRRIRDAMGKRWATDMTRPFCTLVFAVVIATMAAPARAERFGFCEDDVKSATECFLIMTQETYRKCRIVHSMMVIEYGFWESYLPDNNGEKLNFCIDKHRRGIQTPYQAALKEALKHKEVRAALTDLHQAWQGDLE